MKIHDFLCFSTWYIWLYTEVLHGILVYKMQLAFIFPFRKYYFNYMCVLLTSVHHVYALCLQRSEEGTWSLKLVVSCHMGSCQVLCQEQPVLLTSEHLSSLDFFIYLFIYLTSKVLQKINLDWGFIDLFNFNNAKRQI